MVLDNRSAVMKRMCGWEYLSDGNENKIVMLLGKREVPGQPLVK